MFWVLMGCCGCLVVSLLLGLLGVGGVWYMTREPVEAVRAQLADLKGGRMDQAYARMSNGYRSAHSQEEFAQEMSGHPAVSANEDSTFYSRHVSGVTANLSGTLTGGGRTEAVSYDLVYEDGAWKVSSVTFAGGGS